MGRPPFSTVFTVNALRWEKYEEVVFYIKFQTLWWHGPQPSLMFLELEQLSFSTLLTASQFAIKEM